MLVIKLYKDGIIFQSLKRHTCNFSYFFKIAISGRTLGTVEPLLSGLRLTVNSINRASHRYAVPLHFQCAGGVVSG
jgi:hypothetical protein